MVYEWTWTAAAARPGVTGGGLEFRLEQNCPALTAEAKTPVLTERGWRWEIANGQAVEVEFDAAPARLYFERNNAYQIRAFFYADEIPAGERAIRMTVRIPGAIAPSLMERYGSDDDSKWFTRALDLNESFVDLSHLNHKPAGSRGPVRAEGDAYVYGDGAPARFWGVNIQATTLFRMDKPTMDRQARRLARLGFNLVRLHHHDSGTWVVPSLVNTTGAGTDGINDPQLDAYFYWIKALRDQGIYLYIDLYTGRPFKPGDNIPFFDELWAKDSSATKNERGIYIKGYHFGSDRMTELIRKFNRELVTRVNPYTGLAIKDDPAVMTIQLANENDLTNHFGNSFLGDKAVPNFYAAFVAKTDAWAKAKGLDVNAVRQTWLAGPSKLFLNDWEYEWCSETAKQLRAAGVTAPLNWGQQWGNNPLFNLPVVSAGDVVDVHAYESAEFLDRNARYRQHFGTTIAASQVANKPLSVTEYNMGDNAHQDPFTVPLMAAAHAAFQDWDAMMLYGYSQDQLRVATADVWSSHSNPAILGLMPAAALLYREGHVARALETWMVQLDRENAFLKSWTPANSATLRTAAEQHRLVIGLPDVAELDWDRAHSAPAQRILNRLDEDLLPAGLNYVESDTGEIRRDWERGVWTLDTGKSMAAVGWLKNNPIEFERLRIDVTTGKAAVALSSLDGERIENSRRLLLTAVGRVKIVANTGYKSEPIAGKLTLRSQAPSLILVPLNADGTEQAAIEMPRNIEGYTITLPEDRGTHWFLIRER
jgi:hypothetical protein